MRACVRACVRARRALWAACARAHSETLLSSGPLKNPAASRCAAVQPRYLNTFQAWNTGISTSARSHVPRQVARHAPNVRNICRVL